MILDVHITTRCNLRCRHCYLKGLKAEDRRDMPLDIFSNLLIDASLHGVKTLILSGGEPLYHRNIDEVLDAYRLYYGSLAMATNGTLVTDYIDLLSPEDRGIQISLDGDEEFHDWLRGDGVYSAAIQAIEVLRERNITLSVAFTICRENLHCVEHVIELCHRYGIRHVNVNMYMPLSDSELTPITVEEFQRLRARFETSGLKVSEPCYLSGCIAGIEVLSVLPDGTFWDCSRSQIPLGGSIEEARLWEFVAEGRKRESCLKVKPNNLFDLIRDRIEFPRSVDAVRYLDTFREYSIDELEELDRKLRERISRLKGKVTFSGTLNCLYALSVKGKDDAVFYTNNRFLRETREFVKDLARDLDRPAHVGVCRDPVSEHCDYYAFLVKNRPVAITCWGAGNADGEFEGVYRGVDGRLLDKFLIYWYLREFGELPKPWQFFMCDLQCNPDETTRRKYEILCEVFG